MPFYRVRVTEVRHAYVDYVVEADDLEQAKDYAELGETVSEEEQGYDVVDRLLLGEVPVEITDPEELAQYAPATHQVVDFGPGPDDRTAGYPFEGTEAECRAWLSAGQEVTDDLRRRYGVQEIPPE